MTRTSIALLALIGLMSSSAAAQDARAVVAAASMAMGMDGVNAVSFYGSGANYTLGQGNNPNGALPRTNLNNYRRTIDFSQPAMRATAVTHGVPVTDGPAVTRNFQQVVTPANRGWTQQLEIWTTPWGFLKGAAANAATVRTETRDGRRYNVVTWSPQQKAPSGQSYRVVGYINPDNLVERVDTWVEHNIYGDMPVETLFTEYRQTSKGLMFPSAIEQRRAGLKTFDAQILSVDVNPRNLQELLTPPPAEGGRGGGPGGGGGAQQAAIPTEKMAEGVYRIAGGYNSVVIEFADHIMIFEGAAQNEDRVKAVFAEARRLVPNKPVRYAVISHHHFDHTGGITQTVAEGASLVSHEVNRNMLERALGAPRTLAADAMSTSGKAAVFDPVVGDKRVFQDATRTVEIHVVKGLPHADGMLFAYLPKERILAYADIYNAPPPGGMPLSFAATSALVDNLERLKLTFDRAVSVHAPNPDRPITSAEIYESVGRTTGAGD